MGLAGRALHTYPLGCGPHDLLGQGGVGTQIFDNHFHRHRGMFGMPAVVIRHHGKGGIGDFGLPSQAGLRVVSHADHRAAPGAIQLRLGPGGESRPFHAEIGAAPMQAPPLRHEAVAHIFENATEGTAIGIGHGHVGDDPFAKEAEGALVGAVDELIRHHHVEGAVLLLQGAHGRNRQNPAHT